MPEFRYTQSMYNNNYNYIYWWSGFLTPFNIKCLVEVQVNKIIKLKNCVSNRNDLSIKCVLQKLTLY